MIKSEKKQKKMSEQQKKKNQEKEATDKIPHVGFEDVYPSITIPANMRLDIQYSLDLMCWVWAFEIKGQDKVICFNREKFPGLSADEFAKKVIEIIENEILNK